MARWQSVASSTAIVHRSGCFTEVTGRDNAIALHLHYGLMANAENFVLLAKILSIEKSTTNFHCSLHISFVFIQSFYPKLRVGSCRNSTLQWACGPHLAREANSNLKARHGMAWLGYRRTGVRIASLTIRRSTTAPCAVALPACRGYVALQYPQHDDLNSRVCSRALWLLRCSSLPRK